MLVEQIGNLEKSHKETGIEWNITKFFSISENKTSFNSPIFSFVGTSWLLHLKLNSGSKPESMALYLGNGKHSDCSVSYNIGLKKLDGTIEPLSEGIFNGKNGWTGSHYIKLLYIQQRKAELTTSDVLTITCSLKHEITHSDQCGILDKLKKLETLSDNFKSLFANQENCDVTLLVVNKQFKAHRAILIARSSVFAAMFLHETLEKQTGIVTIPDCDPESFNKFLEFLYTGKLEKPLLCSAFHLYKTSDKYDIQELKTFCSDFLMQNMTERNICDIVILADKYEDTNLLLAAETFFNNNLNAIFITSEWQCFMASNNRLASNLLIQMSKKKEVG